MADQVTIRDARKPGFYRIDNELLTQGFGAILKPNGIAIYNAIALYVDFSTQKVKIGYTELGAIVGVHRRTAIREVAKLERLNLISVERIGNEKNRITLLDKSEWTFPKKIEKHYRSDRGKSRPKKKKVVTESHPPVVTKSHSVVTESHPPVVTESHPVVTESPSIPIDQKEQIKNIEHQHLHQNKKIDDGVGGVINSIFSEKGRKEKITSVQIRRIFSEHNLKSETELLKAVRFLAAQDFTFAGKRIGSVIAFLTGSKNGNGGHDSSCFYDGECLFPDPDELSGSDSSPTQGELYENSDAAGTTQTDWQAEFDALSEGEKDSIRIQAEKKLASHKDKMEAGVYKETLNFVALQEFQAWKQEQELKDNA